MPTSQRPLPRLCPTHLWPQPSPEEHLCGAWAVREVRGEAQQLPVVLSSFANLWGLLEPSGMIQTVYSLRVSLLLQHLGWKLNL